MNTKIAIIGGGNLGASIAEGLINSGFTVPQHIIITKRNISTLVALEEKGALVSNDNLEAVGFADYIILAIKPFQIKEVLEQLKPKLDSKRHVLISVVSGVWVMISPSLEPCQIRQLPFKKV
jgi:pyrroline-5-carboxylate reductase